LSVEATYLSVGMSASSRVSFTGWCLSERSRIG
jgi:hypothetical protein